MATAAYIVTQAMRLFKCIDQTESPTTTDMANNVSTLNDLLSAENSDAACQYLMKRASVQLPPGISQQVYTFSIGTADKSYVLQVDAVGVKAIWLNDVNKTVQRETRQSPIADVVRTTYPGIINKWHQERQSDGSVLITAWQPPRVSCMALIEYGARFPILKPDGSDTVPLPREGVLDATMLLGRKIYASYGVVPQPTDTIFADAERVNTKWRDWARGQQWLRYVRN